MSASDDALFNVDQAGCQINGSGNDELVGLLGSALPPKSKHEIMLAMLQFVDERLTLAKIPYWVTGGTCLGAVRHGGFIPHDDDVDIELLEVDLHRAIEALGSVGRSWRGGGEWTDSGVPFGRFFFWSQGGGRFAESIDVFLRTAPMDALKEFPSDQEIFPLQRVPFHNIVVSAPCMPQPFLARCYGPNWHDEVVVWGHSSRSRHMVRATLSDYVWASAAAGYEATSALESASSSLQALGLDCDGELQEHLWQSLGWGSPYLMQCSGKAADDSKLMEMLELESCRIPVPPFLPEIGHLVDELISRGVTAFLQIETVLDRSILHAVGDPDELRFVKDTMASILNLAAELQEAGEVVQECSPEAALTQGHERAGKCFPDLCQARCG